MRLDRLTAKNCGISEEQAAALIMEGRVLLNGAPEPKPGTPVSEKDTVTLLPREKRYASRSGYKLEKALEIFCPDIRGKTVCDIGASNGGFTDCLLQHGAGHVWAVDVAHGILDWRLRNDARVTVLERTNARSLTAEMLGTTCDMVTADVSFISLKKIFPAIGRILRDNGVAVTLVKPQFEAPPKALGKNGAVRDPSVLPPLFLSLFDAAEPSRLFVRGLTVSPIRGQNGNVEYLAFFTRSSPLPVAEREKQIASALAGAPDEFSSKKSLTS